MSAMLTPTSPQHFLPYLSCFLNASPSIVASCSSLKGVRSVCSPAGIVLKARKVSPAMAGTTDSTRANATATLMTVFMVNLLWQVYRASILAPMGDGSACLDKSLLHSLSGEAHRIPPL